MIRVLLVVLALVAGCSAAPAEAPKEPVVLRLSVDEPSPQRVEVVRGQSVEITVTSRSSAEVHVHGFDVLAVAEEGKPASLEFVADRTGTFEVEAHPDTLLAQLVVR
ncbi:hypothetical protein GCM10010492_61670 [Saccharothrix mutabilis subsp. mutabilis]|uniref:EfeO-type cupredoxin-like domain-containing protein n=1 Tax=Saccharothrix mutabilis subsp. mutabilis TaxID=66855 RepID=A0ABP3E5K6_9PSEU